MERISSSLQKKDKRIVKDHKESIRNPTSSQKKCLEKYRSLEPSSIIRNNLTEIPKVITKNVEKRYLEKSQRILRKSLRLCETKKTIPCRTTKVPSKIFPKVIERNLEFTKESSKDLLKDTRDIWSIGKNLEEISRHPHKISRIS